MSRRRRRPRFVRPPRRSGPSGIARASAGAGARRDRRPTAACAKAAPARAARPPATRRRSSARPRGRPRNRRRSRVADRRTIAVGQAAGAKRGRQRRLGLDQSRRRSRRRGAAIAFGAIERMRSPSPRRRRAPAGRRVAIEDRHVAPRARRQWAAVKITRRRHARRCKSPSLRRRARAP